jgi:hypothetical protein
LSSLEPKGGDMLGATRVALESAQRVLGWMGPDAYSAALAMAAAEAGVAVTPKPDWILHSAAGSAARYAIQSSGCDEDSQHCEAEQLAIAAVYYAARALVHHDCEADARLFVDALIEEVGIRVEGEFSLAHLLDRLDVFRNTWVAIMKDIESAAITQSVGPEWPTIR